MIKLIRNNDKLLICIISILCLIDLFVFPILTKDIITIVAKVPTSMRILKCILIASIAIFYVNISNEICRKLCIAFIMCLLSFWFENLSLFDSIIGFFLMQITSLFILYSLVSREYFLMIIFFCISINIIISMILQFV